MAKFMAVNPAKRAPAKKAKKAVAQQKNTQKRRRKAKKNPIANDVFKQVMDAALGAGGALATEVTARMLPLPNSMRTGYVADLTKAGIAIGIGMAVEKLLKQRVEGRKMTEGALTVIAHNIALRAVGPNLGLPATPVGDWDDYGYNYPGVESSFIGAGNATGMGAYMNSAPLMPNTMGAYLDRNLFN